MCMQNRNKITTDKRVSLVNTTRSKTAKQQNQIAKHWKIMSGQVSLKENGILDEDLPTLLENVFKCLSKNLFLLYTGNEFSNEIKLRDDIVIPNEICDRFFKYRQDCSEDINDVFVNIFRDKHKTPLKHIALRNCSITDDGMAILLNHDLVSLSLWYCDMVSLKSWQTLIEHGQNLEYLELGRYVDMLKYSEPNEKTPIDFTLDLPQIRKLILTGIVLQPTVNFGQLQQLNYLDLTQCSFHNEFTLEAIADLPNLTTLILFNVWPLETELPTICRMQKLRKLDISTGYFNTNNYGTFKNPNETLAEIVESLPELTHLDISGTNLAGNGVAQFEAKEQVRSDIPGLVSRANRPLEFLGLYNTAHSACRRHDIPARHISGDANEEQILTSASAYRDRPIMLTKVLNDLYHLLRFETCKSIHRAFEVVLSAMDRHLRVKHMQISGSATLYYIIKGRDKHKYGTPFKNHIIRTLLNGMSTHITDELFEYERLVKILLHAVSDTEQEGFVQRIAIYLLNSLACLVDGKQKLFLGDLGAIGTMLTLIYDRLTRQVFDDVMEVAWSTMWNVTDETAINCERFLDGRGMEYFLECLQCFNDKEELLRNMMGLVGNVAEVKHLRNRLMKSEFITVFSNLLDSDSDGIEVSYNAAGVLAHIASDGPTDWTIDTPSRDDVLSRMSRAIERWNLNTERNINYRSFEPILGLVRCYETPECQHWAVWALANLTKVYPSKYCKLVEEEHGLDLLKELIKHDRPNEKIKALAEMVIKNCEQNKNTESMQLDG